MTRSRVARERAAAISQQTDNLIRSRLRLLGVALVCLKLALIPVIFDYAADVPFTVVKALTSHALAYVLAGVLIGLFVQLGSSFFVWSPLHVPVAAFVATNVVAALFAVDPLLALYGAHERMLGLGTVADHVLLYFAVVLLVRMRREAIAVAASVLVGSLVVLGYEFVQFVGRDPLTWLVDSAVRPFSTIGQANSLAEYLTVLAVGAAAIAFLDARLPRAARVLLVLYSGVALGGAVVTQTRSAVFGIGAGLVVLVALTLLAHPSRRARIASVAIASGAALALVLVVLGTPLGARLLSTVEISSSVEGDAGPRLEGATDVRAALYRIAFDMVRDRPLLGHGPDNFLASLARYRSDHEPYEVQDLPNTSAHSWVAQVAVGSGLLGLVAFLAIPVVAVVLTLKRGFRAETWAALAMMGAFLGEGLTTVNAVSTDQLFWLAAGLIASVTTQRGVGAQPPTVRTPTSKERREQAVEPGLSRLVASSLCVVLGLVLAAWTFNALNASHLAKASTVARLQGRSQQAVSLSLDATRIDPLRAQYWETLGLAYISANRAPDAVSAFTRAGALASYDVRYDGDLARALGEMAQRGDRAAAVQARAVADRIIKTDPNNPLANLSHAFVMQVTGDLPAALISIERAVALDRMNSVGATNNPQIYLTGTQVLTALQRPVEAIAFARAALPKVYEPADQVLIRIELARALAANGQLAEALAEIDKALVVRPDHAGAQQLRAQIVAALH